MTDTPETDGVERESIAAYIEEYGPDAVFPCDGYDHARKLERERDEWQINALLKLAVKQLACMWCGELVHAPTGYEPGTPLNAEQRAQAYQQHVATCPAHPIRDVERERDAAQKAMGDARDILLDAMPDANAPTKILAEMIVAERDILKEHISIMDISHKTANDEYFKLAAENEKLERERDEAQERADTMFAKHVDILDQTRNERDEWKAKYIQQNKDLGCEMMDPNGTIWDYAKKGQRELTVVTKQRDQLEERLRVELGGHPDSELWGDAGLIAATMRCVDALDVVTEQRDRLAAALGKLADCDWVITPHDRMDAVREIARKALQSLTPNEKQ